MEREWRRDGTLVAGVPDYKLMSRLSRAAGQAGLSRQPR
jgi:hypothetical protein